MLKAAPSENLRPLHSQKLACDLVVVGGGLAGACCAITAARAGVKVTLIQDRPVLGGNASSEVRLWTLGATSHLGNNNRWAREGGVIDEILVENLYRNPEGNPILLDALLLEKVVAEPNITLLLNTCVYDLEKRDADTIRSVRAFCSQNSTFYQVEAPLFCDASGDGIVGFLAGAAFRIGVESSSEFGEKFAPSKSSRELLGHTIYFYSKDTGRPVKFIPPSFALQDISKIPRFGDFSAHDTGCKLWWLEWGGLLDTIHESETIKWELWKVAYGVWNYIKNSGKFPEAETLTLEWVGTIPGKRESRRFEGDHMLTQQDIVEQREHEDAVSFGGWAIDLHPVDGVFSKQSGCTQWHAKGVYQIPYRCLYSRNISNLFLAGRIISATHIAFGSTRVMATCAHNGQAVGMAAALCKRHGIAPAELAKKPYIGELQQALLRSGQYIPGAVFADPSDLAPSATLAASSELVLGEFKPSGQTRPLKDSCAMMVPLSGGTTPRMGFLLDVSRDTELHAELRISSKQINHTPDVTLKKIRIPLKAGMQQRVWVDFQAQIEGARYLFFCLMADEAVALHLSEQRATGVLYVSQKFNRAVAKSPCQMPPPDSGVDTFEFWLPERRPNGKNLAIQLDPPIAAFGVANVTNGVARSTYQTNAWVADFEDTEPKLTLSWPAPQTISRIELNFDHDYDHPLESVQMGHPERVLPFCIPRFELRDEAGKLLHQCEENHHARYAICFAAPVKASRLQFSFARSSAEIPAALFQVHCYPASAK
ncbi:MAG: FAD-dependent oxidoreductase [Verrucomicrobia bacterium]|nr:FAD-dependent oxidoreductase [Verrucomicrobiota bacterium]